MRSIGAVPSQLWRLRIVTISVVIMAIVISPALLNVTAADKFVRYSGTHFTLGGRPFYVAGVNNAYIAWASQTEIDNVLRDAKAMNFNVVRTFITPAIGSLDGTTVPTIWSWNNDDDPYNMGMRGSYVRYWDTETNSQGYNDGPTGLEHIDYILYRANRLDLKILLAFDDFHYYEGGMQQMGAWYGGPSAFEQDEYTFVFSNAQAQQAYKDWIAHVLNHVNIYTGVAYKDDPTIFGWDLANEPEASSTDLLQNWIIEMSTYVKSIDTNHLLSPGTEGHFDHGAGNDPDAELAYSTIDFGTLHLYPNHDELTVEESLVSIEQHCEAGAKAKKPVLVEEFGYSWVDHSDVVEVYQLWTDTIYNNPNCAGWMVWVLTSKEDIGTYPVDNGEGFSFHNDGSAIAQTLQAAASKLRGKNSVSFP